MGVKQPGGRFVDIGCEIVVSLFVKILSVENVSTARQGPHNACFEHVGSKQTDSETVCSFFTFPEPSP